MSLNDIVQLAAEARAAELITHIEKGELSYEAVMAELKGGLRS